MVYHFPKTVETSGLDFISLVNKRRSIRVYQPGPVEDNKIETVIAAGNKAPSGANRHPWKFCVITDDKVKKQVRERCEAADKSWHEAADERLRKWLEVKHITTEKKYLTDAPVLIVVFGDTEDPYWIESVWVSVGFMLLAAVDQGLGSLVYTPGDPDFLNEILNVSDRYKPQAILPLGYPVVQPQSTPARQTKLEHKAQTVEEKDEETKEDAAGLLFKENDKTADSQQNVRKCACGCGRPIVGLNSKRKYIHGHAKFGPMGLLKVLKNPPFCKCGCGEPTEWDWEKMAFKKYKDKHIGIRKKPVRRKSALREQFDLFT